MFARIAAQSLGYTYRVRTTLLLTVAVLTAIALLSGCRASGVVVQSQQAISQPPVAATASIHLVKIHMRPQTVVDLPGKAPSLVTPQRAVAQALKHKTAAAEGWSQSGGAFLAGLPAQNVSLDTGSGAGVFQPEVSAQGLPRGMAYAVFQLNLSLFGGDQTLAAVWDPAHQPASTDYYIGFGDLQRDGWEWYAGPADGVLTIPSYGPYRDASGVVLVAIAVLGDTTATLERLTVGTPEQRGTGALDLAGLDVQQLPNLEVQGSLPSAIDLSGECAPIGDQGLWGSCTAFAVGDGAFNHDLAQIYGSFGWDLSNPANRVSPKYLYIRSGQLADEPRDNGRLLPDVLDALQTDGVATELNEPYDLVYSNDPFPAEAQADAALLQIKQWAEMDCHTLEGIASIKAVLAQEHRTPVFGITLDPRFFDYRPGGVWNFDPNFPAASHAMCIVGYDDSKQAFKVRNSWSADWGDQGYAWIGYETFLDQRAFAQVYVLHDEYDSKVRERFCPATDAAPPVTGVEATHGHSGTMHLRWDAYPQATQFNIYRDDPKTPVAQVSPSGNTWNYWIDDAISDVNGHIYWVQPLLAGGSAPLSAPDLGYLESGPKLYSVYPGEGRAGQTVTFRATGLGSPPLSYSWDFGIGATPQTSSAAEPTVTLAAAGIYHAHVTVTNYLASATLPFMLTVDAATPLISTVRHTSGYAGRAIRPLVVISGHADGQYRWQFGAGAVPASSSEAQPEVKYLAAGDYSASVTVQTSSGSDSYHFRQHIIDPADGTWRMVGCNAQQGNQVPFGGPATAHVKWRLFFGGDPAKPLTRGSQCVFGPDSTAFASTERLGLIAVSPDGILKWHRLPEAGGLFTAPLALANGGVACCGAAAIYCFEPDGTLRWQRDDILPEFQMPLLQSTAGDICVYDSSFVVHLLDSQTGADTVPPFALPEYFQNYSFCIGDDDTLYGSTVSALLAIDLSHGVLRWAANVPYLLAGPPRVTPDGQTVYVAGAEGSLYGFRAADGMALPASQRFDLHWPAEIQPLVAADGALRLLHDNRLLTELNPVTGVELETLQLGKSLNPCSYAPTMDVSGNYYLPNENGALSCYEPTAEVRWTLELPELHGYLPIYKYQPSIGPDGTICVCDSQGFLDAVGSGGDGLQHLLPLPTDVYPVRGANNHSYTFTATVLAGPATGYVWDFGGGATPNTTSDAAARVTLGAPGTYNAEVTVSNAYGSDSYPFQLKVN
jgi:PKD repeat protein/C1A family cysteine protease